VVERLRLKRIALALVLAAQVEDEACEEDPEGVEHELRDVDDTGDSSPVLHVARSP
jgi:hypothetical protein